MSDPTMPDDPFPHRLTTSQIAEIFRADVLPTLDATPREQPRLLFLNGQQGAGKTTARNVVADAFDFRNAVQIDGDDYFSFHPHFHELVREAGDALSAMKLCGKDVEALCELTRSYAREQGFNVMLVGPWAAPEGTANIANAFREAQYRVEIASIGTHPALSELGLLDRDHRAKQPDGPGYNVLPGIELHNECVTGVLDTLEAAETRGFADALHVVTRDAIVFSKERNELGAWQPETRVREVMEKTRNQPWNSETKQHFRARRAELGANRRPEWGDRLEHLDATAAPKLAESSASKGPSDTHESRRRVAEAASAYSSTVSGPPTVESSSARQPAENERPRHAHDSSNSHRRQR